MLGTVQGVMVCERVAGIIKQSFIIPSSQIQRVPPIKSNTLIQFLFLFVNSKPLSKISKSNLAKH
jgi:hypothetical protein